CGPTSAALSWCARMVSTLKSRRRVKNGSWLATPCGADRTTNAAPRRTAAAIPGADRGEVPSRRPARTHRRLGIGRQHRRGDYAAADDLSRALDTRHSGTALARASTRSPISGELGLSCQLPLAIHSLRLHP